MSKMINGKNVTYFERLKNFLYSWYIRWSAFYRRYIKMPIYSLYLNMILVNKPTISEIIEMPVSETKEEEIVIIRKTSHSDITNTHEISLHTDSISKNIDHTYIQQSN
jgi:hypothetical protein